jgi:hypothetical protein
MRFLERLSGPRAVLVSALLAGAVVVPSLGMGYAADDFLHLAALEGMDTPAGPLDLFTFARGDPEHTLPFIEHGPYPWWTFPGVKLAFFRPLSSALAFAEHALFGRAPLLAHLHSLLWYVALAAVAAALYQRTLSSRVAVLAAVLFAIDDAHFMPAAWIANRNALIAGVPALLGLWAHLRAREEGWRPGYAWSVLGFCIGLAGGEVALAAFAYLFAYELSREERWSRRLVALAPAAVIGLAYVIAYKALGYGARDSAIYVDPVSTPLRYLAVAPARCFALIGALVMSSPVDLWMFLEASRRRWWARG